MKNPDSRQRQTARRFVEYWTFRRGSEKGEDQQFWNSLLGEVLGMEDVKSHVQYQVPVRMKDTTKFLDAWIPETRVLVEHKSRCIDLDAPQSGHNGLTPYEQALEYDNARPFDEKARWIVVCNFDEFRIHDRGNWVQPEGRGDFDDKPLRSSQGANFSTFGIKDFSSGCWSFHSTRGKVESFCRVAFRYPERDSNWMQPLRSHPLPVRY